MFINTNTQSNKFPNVYQMRRFIKCFVIDKQRLFWMCNVLEGWELDLRDSIKLPKVFLWCTGTYLLYNLFKKINKHMFMLHAPFCRSSNRTWHTETNYLMFIQKALHENFTSIKQTIMERPGIACALGKIWLQVRWQNVPTTKCPSALCTSPAT